MTVAEKIQDLIDNDKHPILIANNIAFNDALYTSEEDDGVTLLNKMQASPVTIAAPLGGDPQTLNGLECTYIPFEQVTAIQWIPTETEDVVVAFKEAYPEFYEKYVNHNVVKGVYVSPTLPGGTKESTATIFAD